MYVWGYDMCKCGIFIDLYLCIELTFCCLCWCCTVRIFDVNGFFFSGQTMVKVIRRILGVKRRILRVRVMMKMNVSSRI